MNKNLSFFLPIFTQKFTYRNVVFVLDQVEWLCCLLALHAKNTLLRSRHLENVITHVEYLCWAWISDLFLSLQTDLNGVVNLDLRLWVVSCQCAWSPLRVHFTDALLDVKLYVDLLISGQLDNGDSELFTLTNAGKISDWLDGSFLLLFIIHAVENGLNVKWGDLTDLLIGIFDTEYKILFAPSTILNFFDWTFAFPGVIKLIGLITNERYQPNSLAKPFIMKYRSVLNDTYKMRSQCWYLWDENSSKSIRQTHVTTWQWKPQLLRTDLYDLDMKLLHWGLLFLWFKILLKGCI